MIKKSETGIFTGYQNVWREEVVRTQYPFFFLSEASNYMTKSEHWK